MSRMRGKKIRSKLLGLVIPALLILLIFSVLIPPAISVELRMDAPYPTSSSGNRVFTFSNVNVTIRGIERIPIIDINFTIFEGSSEVDNVRFYVDGSKYSDTSDKFVTRLVSPSSSTLASWYTEGKGYDYGYSDRYRWGDPAGYGYGYGVASSNNITFSYQVNYTSHASSTTTYRAKFFVNTSLNDVDHVYSSDFSNTFTVTISTGGGGSPGGTTNNAPTADDGGPYIGVAGVPVTFDGTGSTDPDGNTLTYSWEFGDGETGTGSNPEHTYDSAGTYDVNLTVSDGLLTNTSSTTATISESAADSDEDGYKDEMEESYGTDANDDSDYPTDTDGDGIPDDDSPDGKYTGDTDDDNDGLDDETEEELGSKPKDGTDVTTIKIGENTYYLVDTDGDGEIDTIYNPQTGEAAEITVEDGKISIDTDGDGEVDYSYDTVSGKVTEYEGEKKEKPEEFPVWLAILAIIIVVVVIILALIKTGYLYIEDEKPGEKK